MEQVEQCGIDLVDVAGAEVPEEVIHCVQRIRHVRAIAEVLDREPLARVCVREAQGANAHRLSEQPPRRRGDRHGGDKRAPRNVRREQACIE